MSEGHNNEDSEYYSSEEDEKASYDMYKGCNPGFMFEELYNPDCTPEQKEKLYTELINAITTLEKRRGKLPGDPILRSHIGEVLSRGEYSEFFENRGSTGALMKDARFKRLVLLKGSGGRATCARYVPDFHDLRANVSNNPKPKRHPDIKRDATTEPKKQDRPLADPPKVSAWTRPLAFKKPIELERNVDTQPFKFMPPPNDEGEITFPKVLHIAMCGLIAAGKTEFAKRLQRSCKNTITSFEDTKEKLLDKYYQDPSKYATLLQFRLLHKRLLQSTKNAKQTQNVVYDRTFYEDPAFAGMLNHMGFIDDDSLETYMELAWTMFTNGTFRVPDVVIVLDVNPEICLERIQKRGREMEKRIDLHFLKSLAFYYDQMIKHIPCKVYRINWDDYNNVDLFNKTMDSIVADFQ